MAAPRNPERDSTTIDELDHEIDDTVDADTVDDETIDAGGVEGDEELEDGFDDDLDPELDPELDAAEPELGAFDDEGDDLATSDLDSVAAAEDADEDDDDGEPTPTATLPPDAEFDDDASDLVSAVADPDGDVDEVDGLRAGEFVCRSCYLAKRETQLADPKRVLCRDCA